MSVYAGGEGPVALEVRLNGSPPLDASFQVVSARVDESVEALATLTLVVDDGDVTDGSAYWTDHSLTRLGAAVEVSCGYLDGVDQVFSGELTEIGYGISGENESRLTLRAFDRGHRLTRGTATRSFVRRKDSVIAAQIAREAGLRAEVDDSRVMHDYVLQSNQSDLDFLRARAGRTGHEVFVRGQVLHYRRPTPDRRPVRTVVYGTNLIEWDARLTTAGQAGATAVRSWDPRTKSVLQAKSRGPVTLMEGKAPGGKAADRAFGRKVTTLAGVGGGQRAYLQEIADGVQEQASLQHVEATCTVQGDTVLRPGECVRVEGVGERFSGTYYLVEVSHILRDGSYLTQFRARRTAT